MKRIFSAFTFLLLTKSVIIAQSVSIDYTNPGLGTSCNVFATGPDYQNLKHQTTFAFPSYSTTETAVVLQSKPISQSQQGATQYSIAYSFKNGYTYKVRIFGKAVLGSQSASYPSVAIYLSTANGGNNTSTSCNGPASVSGAFDASYGHGVMSSTYAWSGYLFNGVVNQNYSYLLVAAVPQPGTYNQDNTTSTTYIQKIEITEITPVSFTLPSSTNVQCGSTSPIVFTVTNVNNTPNVTYTWNFGANSGWLFNGSPASTPISTGTANSITLTPNCGSSLSNISAIATTGGNDYNTNISVIEFLQPTMSITGSTFFCSGSPVYRISGLPCNASVTWSSNPAGIVSISTNNNQATLTKLADGSTTLLATITSCGKTVTTSLPIQVGVPAPVQSITINGADPMSLCPNTTYAAIANPTVYAQYEWYLPNGWTAFNADSGPDPWVCYDYELDFQTDNYNSGSLAVRRVNNCGASDFTYLETAVNCGYYFYALSPNPAKDKVAIDGRKNDKSIKEVQVIDKSGNLKKTVKYSGKSTLVTLDVSGLSPGLYYLRIFNGQTWEGKPLSIQ